MSLIAGGVTAVDEELKQLSQSYGEKQMALQEAQRKKGGNLMAGELNDVLTEDIMAKVEVLDTEYLKTIFIAIPKSSKENFESGIEQLGKTLLDMVVLIGAVTLASLANPSSLDLWSIVTRKEARLSYLDRSLRSTRIWIVSCTLSRFSRANMRYVVVAHSISWIAVIWC